MPVSFHNKEIPALFSLLSKGARHRVAQHYIDDLELKVIMLCSYCPIPVLVIIDAEPKQLGIPTKAYYAVEEVKEVSHCGFWYCK